MPTRIWAIASLSLLVTSCGSIEQESRIATPIGQTLTAGVGDVVLRAEGRESMPNAFGNADIFGRTRPTGFSTISYGGMQGDKAVLLRSNVVTQSDATTMNSSPLFVPTSEQTTVTGSVGTTPVAASATTTGMAYIPPTGSTSVSASQPTVPILVNWRKDARLPAAGRVIVIKEATPTALIYSIE